jgi:DNA polymerase III sliding clamp (beta) subunit (PCNA family)
LKVTKKAVTVVTIHGGKMKVTFDTSELQKRLSQLAAVVAKKAAQPVFGYIRLAAWKSETGQYPVTITGVDIDSSLTVTFVKAKADGPIDVLLPFTKLAQIVAGVKVAEVEIASADETKATLKAGKYKAELKPHPLANWPTILEQPEVATATVGLADFKEQIADIEFAVPASDGKFVVSVSKVESVPDVPAAGDTPAVPGYLRLVATDGFRLAISSRAANYGQFSLLFPKPALELVKKLDGGAQLTISEVDGGFYFQTELETLTVSRSHGEFPSYERVIPGSFKTELTVDKGLLADAIKRVKPLADSEKAVITFGVTGEGATTLALATSSSEAGAADAAASFLNTASDDVDIKGVKGPAAQFSLDANILEPFIDRAYGSKSGEITIRIVAVDRVVDFLANGGTYRFLQMPCATK